MKPLKKLIQCWKKQLKTMNKINFTIDELKRYWSDNRICFFTKTHLWQLHYTHNTGYSFTRVMAIYDKAMTRGRFVAVTPELANKIIGSK